MCWKNPWYVEIGKGSFKFTPEKTMPCVKTAATAVPVPIEMDLPMKPPLFSSALPGEILRSFLWNDRNCVSSTGYRKTAKENQGQSLRAQRQPPGYRRGRAAARCAARRARRILHQGDRKSTRLNSSHLGI